MPSREKIKSIKNHFVCFVDAIRNWKSDQWGVRVGTPTISRRHVQLCNSYIGRCRESIPWLYRSHQQDIWHYSPFFFFLFSSYSRGSRVLLSVVLLFLVFFVSLFLVISLFINRFYFFNLMWRFVDSGMRKNPEALGMLHQVVVLYTHVSISVKLSCSILLINCFSKSFETKRDN